MGREELADPETQRILLVQHHDNIDVRIAWRDELPAASDFSGRSTHSSCDFAICDDRAVTDVFIHPGKYFGRKTSQPGEVEKYLRLYELIEHGSHCIAVEDGRLVLASEIVSAAVNG